MSWFPVTDLSREDDIRMRRRRALLLVSCIVFVPWLMWGDHHARRSAVRVGAAPFRIVLPDAANGQSETRRIAAPALQVDLPCADSVTILPDPTLAGQAILSVPARSRAVLDEMAVSNGAITGGRSCADDAPVTIRTSNVMPLVLVQSGDNTLHVGRFDGPVSVDSTGSGTVSVESAGTLVVNGRRDGDVTVGRVVGPLTATMMGSGDLRVDGGTVPVIELASRGSGDLLLDGVRALGGRVSLTGSGDFRLGDAAGAIEADTEGSGSIQIRKVQLDHLALTGNGSGDIGIGAGRIGMLQATRNGSGSLTIDASIDRGTLAHDGSGDVAIPDGGALVRTR